MWTQRGPGLELDVALPRPETLGVLLHALQAVLPRGTSVGVHSHWEGMQPLERDLANALHRQDLTGRGNAVDRDGDDDDDCNPQPLHSSALAASRLVRALAL